MEITRLPDESPEYAAAREKLRIAELELVQQRERVAEMRRALPSGTVVENYAFLDGSRTVPLRDLFTAPDRALIVYHLMYGKRQTEPCPMCTMWIDGFDGVVHHVTQNADFVVVAAADPEPLRAHARHRGWDRLRVLSCGANTFKYDLGSEDADGNQDSKISVFALDGDGAIRHTYSTQPRMAPDVAERGIDLLCATYNLLDLTPGGRGNWYASLDD